MRKKKMNKCAICGKSTKFDLYNSCWKTFKGEAWAKALVKIDKHARYLDSTNREISFCDLSERELESLNCTH
jgi:hypothetical protein